ncbi:hypothetical protein Ddc_04356 [Ditylenchus destructor]|nr:hypothetical protein Ddc_04356 [Ditylenchus destructor]
MRKLTISCLFISILAFSITFANAEDDSLNKGSTAIKRSAAPKEVIVVNREEEQALQRRIAETFKARHAGGPQKPK